MEIPCQRTTFTVEYSVTASENTYIFEAKNHANSCTLMLKREEENIWHTELPKIALLATISDNFMAIAFLDCSILIYSLSGRK
jgi:hypothetical protein